MPMRGLDRILGLPALRLHQAVYEWTGGRLGARVLEVRMLLLRTRGRRTGRLRTAALLYEADGGRLVVIASKGGSDTAPAWFLNLRADPVCEVQVGTRRFPARARQATGAEARRLWRLMAGRWPPYDAYQARTRRAIPVVVLEPLG